MTLNRASEIMTGGGIWLLCEWAFQQITLQPLTWQKAATCIGVGFVLFLVNEFKNGDATNQ